VTPPVRGLSALILHDLGGDAGLSGVVLVILLIPILLYGLLARRREQQATALAEQRRQGDGVRSGHGTMLADPLLEFFGPQHARPVEPSISARQIAAPRFQPRPGLTGRSTMSASLAARSGMPAAGAAPGQSPGARYGQAGLPEPSARRPVTSAPAGSTWSRPDGAAGAGGPGEVGGPGDLARAAGSAGATAAGGALPIRVRGVFAGSPTVRQAPVTGTPPWEPAREPTSDLPWAVIAPQQAASRPAGLEVPPSIAPPPDSVWDSTPGQRSQTPQPQFQPAPAQPPWDDANAVPPAQAGQGQPGAEPDPVPAVSERGPVFMWNPADAADQFSTVDPASTDWQGIGQDRNRD
jgi:hypothetical protein